MAVNSTSATVKIIIQQCLSAKLQVQPAQGDNRAQYVEVGRGIVVYVCFLRGVTMEMMPRVVKSVLNVKLSSSQERKVSVLDLPGDVLIVPQATLGGKLKGKNVQSILECASPVFHRALPTYFSEDLERVQKRAALRIIYSTLSYNQALELSGLPTLFQRRESISTDLFSEISSKREHKLHK